MTLENKILDIKVSFVNSVSYIFEKIARIFFNYPNNPGMPMLDFVDSNRKEIFNYISDLPVHLSTFPPLAVPQTLSQCFLGNYPILPTIQRTFYEHKLDGFYNFYVLNYQNIFFLPDWLSQWIQINFEITVDDSQLMAIREGLFVGLLGYMFLLDFRMKLFWFLTINPYTRPWIYLLSITDWLFDLLSGAVPVVLGLDLSATIMLTLFGKMVDSLNHLVFTMPFLPSEGIPGQMVIDGELKDVILFRYLPSLWYTNPIPDKLREFWYTQRPEILNFMQKNYGHLDIDFLPNRILKEIYEKEQIQNISLNNLYSISNKLISIIPDQVIPLTNFSFNPDINFSNSIYSTIIT
jgi:hypothetical protein